MSLFQSNDIIEKDIHYQNKMLQSVSDFCLNHPTTATNHEGMAQFQYTTSPESLESLHQMDPDTMRQGVVGETITDLFCDYKK